MNKDMIYQSLKNLIFFLKKTAVILARKMLRVTKTKAFFVKSSASVSRDPRQVNLAACAKVGRLKWVENKFFRRGNVFLTRAWSIDSPIFLRSLTIVIAALSAILISRTDSKISWRSQSKVLYPSIRSWSFYNTKKRESLALFEKEWRGTNGA